MPRRRSRWPWRWSVSGGSIIWLTAPAGASHRRCTKPATNCFAASAIGWAAADAAIGTLVLAPTCATPGIARSQAIMDEWRDGAHYMRMRAVRRADGKPVGTAPITAAESAAEQK